jgi:hypothetical protein
VGGKWLDDKSCCRHAQLASSGPDFFSVALFLPAVDFCYLMILHVGFFFCGVLVKTMSNVPRQTTSRSHTYISIQENCSSPTINSFLIIFQNYFQDFVHWKTGLS